MSPSALSQTTVTLLLGWMLAGTMWATPAMAQRPPLVEPRDSRPDSVRILERARADSLRATQPHMGGGAAFAIGLASTLGPPAVALLANPPSGGSEHGWETSLTLGSMIGVLAGPAIGLAAGGRGDLATRGLKARGISYAVMLAGVAAVGAASYDTSPGAVGSAAIVLAVFGGAGVSLISCFYDLSITPSAVGPAKSFSVRPVVDTQGRIALQASF